MSYISDDFAPLCGIQELSFDEINLVNGAINWGNVAVASWQGAVIGGITGATTGAMAGSLAGGGGALPGALSVGLIGATAGSIGGAVAALLNEFSESADDC